MKTVAIVQARLNSTRLPGKVLYEVAGRPMIVLEFERIGRSRKVDDVVLATGDGPENDTLESVIASMGFPVFRGPEQDVLARYALAAKAHNADVVVRLTGDCPLLDPGIVDALLDMQAHGALDFCTNVLPPSWPDGLDAAVFTRDVLEAAHQEAERPSDREHVVPWMWRQTPLNGGNRFAAENLIAPEDLSCHRWTVDEAGDYLFLRALADHLGPSAMTTVGYEEVLEVLRAHPDIAGLNRGLERDAGYSKSLADETKETAS